MGEAAAAGEDPGAPAGEDLAAGAGAAGADLGEEALEQIVLHTHAGEDPGPGGEGGRSGGSGSWLGNRRQVDPGAGAGRRGQRRAGSGPLTRPRIWTMQELRLSTARASPLQ